MMLSPSPTPVRDTLGATKADEGPRAIPEAPSIAVEECGSPRELAGHEGAWAELAKNALAPNSFYEPWMLLPAIEAFAARASLRHLLIWRNDPGKPRAPRMLIGYFPLEERRRLKGLPIRNLTLWKHMHCFLCTPLLHREHGREALSALFGWMRKGKTPRILELPLVNGDGPFQHALLDVLNEEGHVTFQDEAYNRALLRRGMDGEGYLEQTLSTGNRKELRRQRRRLGESGSLEMRVLTEAAHIDEWVGHFLTLEKSGWKGQEGTALASEETQREYFRRITRAGFERGKVMMLGLFLDGRPIALKCNFVSEPGSFAFKIAFDESLSRFSPGVQLELDNVLQMHSRTGLEWMDSCAVSRHFMINRLWKDRRIVQNLWISTGGPLADLAVGALPWLRALRRFGRRSRVASDRSST